MSNRDQYEFDRFTESYVILVRKYHRCFPVMVVKALDREHEVEMQVEIKRIESVLEFFREYLRNLAQYVENGHEYRFHDGFEVLSPLPVNQIVRFEAEMARIRYILDK